MSDYATRPFSGTNAPVAIAPQRYWLVRTVGDKPPHVLWSDLGSLRIDNARELLENEMWQHSYDHPEYSVLEGHDGMYFDGWCDGERTVLVRIVDASAAEQA